MALYDVNGNVILTGGQMPSVVDYGADNTGTTECSTAIQAAVSACEMVYFPAGTYLISSIIYIPSNRFLYFDPGATLKRIASTNCMVTSAGDSSIVGYDGVHDITIYGATFDVNGSVYTYNCTALSFCHAKRIKTIASAFISLSFPKNLVI